MLRPIGHVTSADASSVLPRIDAPPSGHWVRLVNKVSAQLQQQYASKLFAIALRGSTARGTAVTGVSDLDLIVLLNHPATDIPSGRLSRCHRVKVDLAQSTYPEFMTQPKWAWMRFSLPFFGSVISGPDFISTCLIRPSNSIASHISKSVTDGLLTGNRYIRPPHNPSRRRRSANG